MVSRRKFLKGSVAGVLVAVVAGVGTFLALQQPQTSSTPRPVATPTPVPSVAPSPQPTPTLVDKANEEGAATMYSSFDIDTVKGIVDGFNKKYPKIKVEIVRNDGLVLLQRILTERRAGKDVCDLNITGATYILPALEEGVVAQYTSKEDEAYSAELRDPKGYWIATQLSPQAMAYNTERVKGGDVPKSFWDLTKPRFKDRLGVYNAAPHAFLITKKKIIGEARYIEFLRGLRAQNPKVVTGTGQAMTLLKAGEVEAFLWVYTGTTTETMKQGAPVDYVRQRGTLLAPPSIVYINKFAPHPNAGRLLRDYTISEEGEMIVGDMGKYVMARKGIPAKMGLGIGTGEPVTLDMVDFLWPYTQAEIEAAQKEFDSILKA